MITSHVKVSAQLPQSGVASLPDEPGNSNIQFEADAAPSPPSGRTIFLYAVLAGMVGLGNAFTIRLVGLMPVSEIFLLGMALWTAICLAVTRRIAAPLVANRLFAFLLCCQLVAFGSYVTADLYRGSAPGDAFRGWARMFFLAVDVLTVALLFGKSPRVFAAYLFGGVLSASSILINEPLFGDYWKFGYGYPLTVLMLLVCPALGAPGAILGMFGMGVAHYFMDYRSLAIVCWLVAGLALLNQFSPRWRLRFFLGGVVAVAAALFYIANTSNDGDNARHGRSNAERSAMIQAATEAIAASPFLGHGSWFSRTRVMDNFVDIRTENARLAGVGGFDETNGEEMAIHSQILVSMAEGGILGGAFFVAYGLGMLWALWYCAVVREWSYYSVAFLFVLLSSTNALCLSPFSGSARVEIAAATGVVLLLFRERLDARLRNSEAIFQNSPINPITKATVQ
jgi:hypothetical protein